MNQPAVPMPRSRVKEPPYAWIILLSVYLASLAAPLNQFKVPPVLELINAEFKMDLSGGGLFMSVFSIAGCILAIPAALIIRRLGMKKAGLIAVGSVFVGALIGSLAGTSRVLYAGRLIEGVGMGLIMVMAPAAIALWFPANRRGAPMALWATCVGIGSISMYNLAPLLATSYGLKSVWWLGTGAAFFAFILFAMLFRSPRPDEIPEEPGPGGAAVPAVSFGAVMSNPRMWMLSLQFLCFNLIVMAFSTFYPTFLFDVRGYSLSRAASVSSLIMVVSIFAGPLAGYMTDRVWKRSYWILCAWVVGAVLYAFPFSVTGWMIPGLLVAMGILTAPIVPASFAVIPEVVGSPRLAGMGMAVMALGQNVGMLIGPWAFGHSIENFGWMTSCYLLLPFFLVAFVATWFAKVK
ncbi:MAG: MFS transporter [Acidobacteria bacterium]|nr:MFS transporter [Acidobacteriota bacterium]